MAERSLNSLSVGYVEQLYAEFAKRPDRVPPDWRVYFQQLATGNGDAGLAHHSLLLRPTSIFNPPAGKNVAPLRDELDAARRQEGVDQLIRSYRVRGHMIAQVDPLERPRPNLPELDPRLYGLREADFERPFSTRTMQGSDVQTLRTILRRLQDSYCGYIGAHFMHIHDLSVRDWLLQRLENPQRPKLSRDQQLRIFTRLTDAVIFEEFLRRKYVGAKTFSLEGAESLIPLLDLSMEKAADQGIREVVMAMAHRGRLNVLANIVGKSAREIFHEFEDVPAQRRRPLGDVKYHLGYHNDWTTASGRKLHLSLCFNPSHLEFVDPVAMGLARAKQDRRGDLAREEVLALLIHGDAAFSGEGIIQESLNLSQLAGYTTGGALHVIVNNQIGFTTPPEQGRSTTYTSDVAKILQVPVFLVNGEHPEAVAQVVALAMDFRETFRRDAFIDMYCYRRWGHNEGDEPSFTQPLLYQAIQRRKSVREGYLEHLLKLGQVTSAEADSIAHHRRENLEQELSRARQQDFVPRPQILGEMWKAYHGGAENPKDDVETAVDLRQLATFLERLTELPETFHLHAKLQRWMENRRAMARAQLPVDWSTAEALAFATLAVQGYRVRLSGQDSARGTFSQRHAVLHDTEDGHTYVPLQHVASDQAAVEIVNSPLSEAGVLGFEYGYSLGFPDALVLWEAQFGDFANAAQVIIDQFLASAEEKWQHLSGLVLLLPHGLEGQGPEHSSARPERFLQLAAKENLQVVVPSTPAQYFHCLRRQAVRRWQKPLIVLTPKGLLRHPRCVSALEELASGHFRRVIPDSPPADRTRLDRVLMCSGKLYYELLEKRDRQLRTDVALVRLEQLYPLPDKLLAAALEPCPDGTPVYWVQEEPENMGAWRYLQASLGERVFGRFPLAGISRPASGSPATGSASSYRQEQEKLLARAFGEQNAAT